MRTTLAIEVPALDDVARLSDLELTAAVSAAASARRRVDAVIAGLAAELRRRSTREHGHDGLAQRAGARTPEIFLSQLTGLSTGESHTLTAVGTLVDAPPVWLTDVADGVASGSLSAGAAAAITGGLGTPSAAVGADDLLDAAQKLVVEAATLPPEKVARRARELRDELDASGVADRETQLRERRYLRLTPQPDGMTRLHGLLDPESAALVTDAIDCVTAPRRGGPRFIDTAERERAEALQRDTRTTEQIAADALVEMIRIAAHADTGRVFGVRRPSVRVHVDARDLERRSGAARVEGQAASVSIATTERLACADGYIPIVFEPDGTVDVGRTQRLFTTRQRLALDAIWGGCAHPACDRPPSWCEAHHATEWHRHQGNTDIRNGILLCRHHHMLIHNKQRLDHPTTRFSRLRRETMDAPPTTRRSTQPDPDPADTETDRTGVVRVDSATQAGAPQKGASSATVAERAASR